MIYKVLPMWQPWGQLVVIGAKKFETRSRDTKVRGTILIHACKKWNNDLQDVAFSEPFCSSLFGEKRTLADLLTPLPLGYIIGAVDIVETYFIQKATLPYNIPAGVSLNETYGIKAIYPGLNKILLPSANEIAFGNYSPGRFAWKLENRRMLKEPIPFKAQQGWSKFETEKELEFI